jgi:acyl-CoA thioesterase I
MTKFFIFGDSLPYGKWDTELNGWASRLRRFLDEKVMAGNGYYETYNFGVPGDYSEGVLKRFESDLRPRFRDGEDIVIIFQLGVNDTQFQKEAGKLRTSKEEFEKNLRELIGIAQKYTLKVAFLGLTPINEEQTLTVPWYKDNYYKNKWLAEYNEIIKKVCEEKGAHFLELFDKLNQERYFENLVDGLHPNAKGHEWMFRIVRDFLRDKKILD